MKSGKYICFTIYHDYSEDYEQQLLDKFEQWERCSYVIFQFELCPTTQRCHVQGYAEFTNSVKRKTFQSKIAKSAHLETRRGTSEEASDYCSKEETRLQSTEPSEYGTRSASKQGFRSDIATAAQSIVEGKTLREIAIADPVCFVRHNRGLSALQTVLRADKRTWKPEVYILWGPPGSGKTRHVYDTHGFDNIYEVPTPRSGSEVWFDGYQGHEVILVDDFYGWFRWSFLLKFIDRYPQDLPVKGKHIALLGIRGEYNI